jgi:hypothetical protein
MATLQADDPFATLTTRQGKPEQLAGGIPGEDEQQQLAQEVADAPTPDLGGSAELSAEGEVPLDFSAEATGDLDFSAEATGDVEESAPEAEDETVDVREVEPGFFQANFTPSGLKRQFNNMALRAAAEIAGDSESQKLTLENKLGEENVEVVKDAKGNIDYFNVRRPGEKGFSRLDPAIFDIMNDLGADFFSFHLAQGMGAAGAAFGSPLGIPGKIAGGILGASAGFAAADFIGEQGLGVIRSPEEAAKGVGQRTFETIEEGATLAALNTGINAIVAKGKKWLDGRAAVKKLKDANPGEVLNETVQENLKTMQELKQLKVIQNIPGTDMPLMAHQLYPSVNKVTEAAMRDGGVPLFKAAQNVAEEGMNAAMIDMIESSAGIVGGTVKEALKKGLAADRPALARRVVGLFDKVQKEQGKLIGEARKKVSKLMARKPLQVPHTTKAINNIIEETGTIIGPNGKLHFRPNEELVGILGAESPLVLDGFKSDIRKLHSNITKNKGLRIDELISEAKLLGTKSGTARRIGHLYSSLRGQLASAVRRDSRESTVEALGGIESAAGKEFEASMTRFKTIADATDVLGRSLDDQLANNVFVRSLVNRGKKGFSSLQAAKEFLLQENPKLWEEVTAEYLEETTLLAAKGRIGSNFQFNPTAVAEKLRGLGNEYLNTLFPKHLGGKELVMKTLKLAEQVERTVIHGTDNQLQRDFQKVAGAMGPQRRGINFYYMVTNWYNKDGRVAKLMTREGIESMLIKVAPKDKPYVRRMFETMIAAGRESGLLSKSFAETAEKTGIAAGAKASQIAGDAAKAALDPAGRALTVETVKNPKEAGFSSVKAGLSGLKSGLDVFTGK